MKTLLDVANLYLASGFSVIPIKTDGSKRPSELLPKDEKGLPTWKPFQTTPATESELSDWFRKSVGIGIIGGAVSGGLEVLDFEDKAGRNATDACLKLVEERGGADLLKRLVWINTPSGGLHLYYRCEKIEGGQKLARFVEGEDANGKPKILTLIETRGEGNYVLAPGCPVSCHPTGRTYKLRHGKLDQVPTITPEERELLLSCARSFDEVGSLMPKGAERPPRDFSPSGENLRPGDDFNRRHSIEDLLVPAGWTQLPFGGKWRKPGSKDGDHATWDYKGSGCLYVFSTNAHPFEAERSYDLFAIYTLLNHNGDFRAATADLRAKGYGTPPPERRILPPESRAIATKTDSIKPASTPAGATSAPRREPPEPSSWGDPVPLFEAAAPKKLSIEYLPKCLQEFARQVSHVTQTPEDMVVSMIPAAISVAAQKKFKVTRSSEESDWTEPVNVWIVCAVKSGSRKTEVFNYATKPIRDWEKLEAQRTEYDRAKHNAKRKLMLGRLAELERKKGDDIDFDQVADQIASLKLMIQDEWYDPKLLDDEGTVEGLERRFVEYGGRWAFFSDEGGLFEVLAGLYNGGRTNLNVLLKAHPGSDLRVVRGGRESDIKNPALTLGLMVQPAVIEGLGRVGSFRSTGGLARFLYVIPESNIGKRNARLIAKVDPHVKKEYDKIVQAILDIPYPNDPRLLSLSPDALETFLQFCERVEPLLGEQQPLGQVDDWGSKLAGQALRIAALFHLAEQSARGYLAQGVNGGDWCEMTIQEPTLRLALEYASVLISHAVHAFGVMGNETAVADAAAIVRYMVKLDGPVKERDLKQMERFKKSATERFTVAMEELAVRYLVRAVPMETRAGRPPSQGYELNPACRKRGALSELVG